MNSRVWFPAWHIPRGQAAAPVPRHAAVLFFLPSSPHPCPSSPTPQLCIVHPTTTTYIFSRTMPLAMAAPPSGLAFMCVTECALFQVLEAHFSFRRCTRSLRPALDPEGLLW